VNLYAFVGNDPVSRWDKLGLEWKTSNCKGISIGIGGSAYVGVGGGGSVTISGEKCDCCNTSTGEIIKEGYWKVGVTAKAQIGFGIGGHIRILGFQFSIGQITGPQLELINLSVSYNKNCGEEGKGYFKNEKAINLGLGARIANASISGGARGFAGIEIEFTNKSYKSYKYYGWSWHANLTIHLGLFSINPRYSDNRPKTKILIAQGSF